MAASLGEVSCEKLLVNKAVTFSVNVVSTDKNNNITKAPVVRNAIRQIDSNCTWFDLFESATNHLPEDHDEISDQVFKDFEKIASISVGSSQNDMNQFYPDPYDNINVLTDFDHSLKYVTIKLKISSKSTDDVEPGKTQDGVNAFSMLMQSTNTATKEPKKIQEDKPRFSEKDHLQNDLVVHFQESSIEFPRSMSDDTVDKHMSVVTNTLWYLDGNKEKIQERAKHSREVQSLPERFVKQFNGYNDWRRKRKKAPQLQSSELKKHSGLLFRLISSAFTSKWGDFRGDLENMALSLNSYAEYLEKETVNQLKRQNLEHPPREVGKHCLLEHHMPTESVRPRYSILDNALCKTETYQYIVFSEENYLGKDSHFKDYNDKYNFMLNLKVSVPVDILHYNPGGSHGSVTVLWRTPEQRHEKEVLNMSLKVVEQVKPLLPEFHTRQMRNNFFKNYSRLTNLSPAMLRVIYSDLSLDATTDQNPALEERIRQSILSEDVDLLTDLRHVNKGRPNDTFVSFFDTLGRKVEELCAADERRHNIEHMSDFISVKDLISQVQGDLPPGTPIPSESTVLFSFVPKNAHKKSAKLYKSIIPVQFKVQSRQLRSTHKDDHYCAAIFKYLRQYAVKYRDHVTMLCVDDKSKVDFGEPGSAVSSGVRGKKSIVPVSSSLSALDHDLQSKGSITPSVCLTIEIPNSIEESFYRGKVTVTYKDAIFQASTPFRHGVEMEQMLRRNGAHDSQSPVLLLYSDGGPDHRVTYHSVKLALIVLFKKLDLDLLIAARTAPGHSWLNPAERIMSVLNLAIQNVALMREESTPEIETTLRGANSMSEIRSKAGRVSALKQSWMQSVQPVIDILENRTSRLSLKSVPFECQKPATDEEVQQFEQQLLHTVDGTVTLGQYQAKHLKSKSDYQKFLNEHCIERQYLFQIRKCDVETCCSRRRSEVDFPWVPDPLKNPADPSHYQSFEALVGKETSEKDRPSGIDKMEMILAEQKQGVRNAGLVAQNIRLIVTCYECHKPRCIYASRKLSVRDLRSFNRILERHDYTCGSLIVPEGDILQNSVAVRLQMTCLTPVEFAFYADANPVKVSKDTCCHCAETGAEKDQELIKNYKTVLPVCHGCVRMGRQVPKRTPIKK